MTFPLAAQKELPIAVALLEARWFDFAMKATATPTTRVLVVRGTVRRFNGTVEYHLITDAYFAIVVELAHHVRFLWTRRQLDRFGVARRGKDKERGGERY